MDEEAYVAWSIYFALVVIQILFVILWRIDVISWHWALVFLPLWMLLSLPLASYIGAAMLERGK